MFNVGGPEFLIIVLVALVILGPQQLPKAMRTFGNVMAEVRKVSSSFQAEMRNAMDTVADTTGTEKPQSGTMAAAEPAATASSPDRSEVVARNDSDSHDAQSEAALPADADDGSDVPANGGLPPIDPADRAAG